MLSIQPHIYTSFILAMLPTYLIRFEIFGIPMTLFEVLLLSYICYIYFTQIKSLRVFISPLHSHKIFSICIALFLISGIISVFISPISINALGLLKAYIIEPVLFFLIALHTLKTREHIYSAINALACTAIIISIYAIIQKFTGWNIPEIWFAERRVTSFFQYPNAIGLFLAPLIPIFIIRALNNLKQKKDIKKYKLQRTSFLLSAAILSLIAIIFSKTEAALVALFATVIIYGFFCKDPLCNNLFYCNDKFLATNNSTLVNEYAVFTSSCIHCFRSKICHFVTKNYYAAGLNKKTAIISVVLVIAGIFIVLYSPLLQSKLFFQDWSGVVRRITWHETWSMLTSSPTRIMFGAGLSGYPTTFEPFHSHKTIELFQYPHNIILNFWSEIGLLGLISFFSICIYTLLFKTKNNIMSACESRKKIEIFDIKYAFILSILIIFIHGFVDVPYFKNDLSVLFWFLIVALFVLRTKID